MSDPDIRRTPQGRELACFDRGDQVLLVATDDLLVVREERQVLEAALAALGGEHGELGLSAGERERAEAVREALAGPPARIPDGVDDAAPIGQVNVCNTLRCNLRCRYCYNELDAKEQKGSAAREVMPIELGQRVVDALLDQDRAPDELALVFIGGESLLDRAGLDAIIRYGHRRCEARGRGLAPVVYTNGVLLDEATIAWANELHISLVLSLDGPPAVNDRFRVLPSGAPSSPAVLAAIDRLMQHGRQRMRRVRAVTTEPTALLPLHQYLYDLGFNDLYVQAAYDVQGVVDRDQVLDLQALVDWYRTLLLSGVIVAVHPVPTLLERLRGRGRATANRFPCGAGVETLGVGPDGTWYTCHHFVGERAFALGNARDGLPDAVARRAASRAVERRQPCATCWARHLCGGECYHRAVTAGLGFEGVMEQNCARRKKIFELGVELLTDVRSRRPDALGALHDGELSLLPPNPLAFEQQDLRLYLTPARDRQGGV